MGYGSECKIMPIGHNNVKYNYELYRQNFTKVTKEQDLGLVETNYLKSATQCSAVSRKANVIL